MVEKVLVTGATGHIGCNVVRALAASGRFEPVALAREGADRSALRGLDVEVRTGDLLDPASLEKAMEGVSSVAHVGAVHRNFAADPQVIVKPAVEGTRNVIAAARKRGVRRIVYTSTGATIGFAEDPGKPLDETAFKTSSRAPYVLGKIEAEKVALEAARAASAPVIVILNPSGVFGPRDHRLTPASRAVVGLLQGDPMFLHLCYTDVRDVAHAHLVALEKGRHGERYLVTGELLAPEQSAATFAEVTGVRPKVMRPPGFLLRLVAWNAERVARKTGADAPISRDILDDVGDGHLAYDARKSRDELGMTYRSPKEVVRDTARWLLHVGALKPKVAATVKAALGDRAAPDADWS